MGQEVKVTSQKETCNQVFQSVPHKGQKLDLGGLLQIRKAGGGKEAERERERAREIRVV